MIDEGLPVFGYCPWSFVDVVSSHQGFAKRYGLVYVDRTETDPKQCARVKKDSFYWYHYVITNNGLTEEAITYFPRSRAGNVLRCLHGCFVV